MIWLRVLEVRSLPLSLSLIATIRTLPTSMS